jgi:hypothetical protein
MRGRLSTRARATLCAPTGIRTAVAVALAEAELGEGQGDIYARIAQARALL